MRCLIPGKKGVKVHVASYFLTLNWFSIVHGLFPIHCKVQATFTWAFSFFFLLFLAVFIAFIL